MGKKLTSGPFFVPVSIDGSDDGAVEFLLIGFKNLADKSSTVDVSVHVCNDISLYPATPPEIEIFRKEVTIPAGHCAVLKLPAIETDDGKPTFTGNNMLRVAIEGDTDEEAKGIVAALSGGKDDGRTAVSMVFKHEDFIKLKD
ncbi:hypothetical protein GCM10009865_03550 [Aeromicrobium ponti]|uniref:Uncharacterized protein n=1 Tax=Cytobacillus oceanisediminis TaxID=665099 RepID=A0A562K5V9_9BACI|nr:hypothetical protein [Cytobacillus oceanisediminis]TWH90812.1 hypothetical protein IQ19_00262 [Cytobacillus oceanisediminis]